MVRSTIRGTAPNALGQNYELARFAAPYDLDIHRIHPVSPTFLFR
jgi:hypothetical protein